MMLSPDQLTQQALQLPPALRARLADQLVESLAGADDAELKKLWADEALRRHDEVRSGQVAPIPGEQVLAEVRRAVGR